MSVGVTKMYEIRIFYCYPSLNPLSKYIYTHKHENTYTHNIGDIRYLGPNFPTKSGKFTRYFPRTSIDFTSVSSTEGLGASAAQWQHTGLLVNKSSGRFCTSGRFHNNIHHITGCTPALYSLTMQNRGLNTNHFLFIPTKRLQYISQPSLDYISQ